MHLSFFHSCSDLEDVEEIFEKLKCGTFKILDFCLLFFLKSLNEVLSVWKELYKRGRPFLNSFQVLNQQKLSVTESTLQSHITLYIMTVALKVKSRANHYKKIPDNM